MVEDNYRQRGLRKQLVLELSQKGIQNKQVLEAIMAVPRHLFLDKAFEEWAYKDNAFPIDCDQTISQPYTVAFQTSLLDLQPKDKVLEIGTGSGYQACVLLEMGVKVYTVERHKTLHDKTEKLLTKIGYKSIRTFFGDGYLGLPRFAPFDKILITAAVPEIPTTLIDQLKPGGILVIPLDDHKQSQTMMRIYKLQDGRLKKESFGQFRFVPMLQGVE
ncbi:MAG: protein-L-isoaspartate(D-aspartate) O-methyltransferase [Saprospiraceae bacterium]|uniref:Protein-L-isoaspartate O-methyltransferase n=1 Tax=Candidatus Defluviibacterium haderslevense TaxID=2981993 RepID=A0A9D7XDI3_9BACT|nr:protein-L-isoaspartate(D-aspartate) O-methyltransferase [Candidatus Defluviibacterium haderslevense]